ncbi:uncharacterized protein LOC119770430 [Culex quinquefasciatus]|uniref:uncharacterized protein LOC119770430 n=1 Tax=Culex quinquefasciatus TaxID=7176 RepID=UPI0018E3583B|nr:uncharacterized protein LOC119770430 [Culex quinquefasciatus]
MAQINANNLELVLDVYDDGTIEVAREQVNGHQRRHNTNQHHHHPVVECCSELSCQPPVEKLFERLPEENVLEVSSSDDSEPELVEVACPCRCDGCHGRYHRKVARAGRGAAAQDEVVMMEANIRVKVPIKRKHFERLVQMARVCQERSP